MRIRSAGAVASVAGVLALASLVGCSGSSDGGTASDGADRSARSTTTMSAPPRWTAKVDGEDDVDGNFRQGLARSGDGWIFVTNNAIYRTDADFAETASHKEAIPPELAAQGYDHLGDPDVADGMIWIPVERDDKTSGEQVTARYDEDTLAFVDSFPVAQHHNAFVAVDDDGTVYSTDQFDDDAVVRYRVTDGKAVPAKPLQLSRTVERIQGGDVADGALWLSTDDDHNGVYRVDLETGEVTDLGTAGHVEGEGEGIDAGPAEGAGTDVQVALHALVADQAIVPLWVVALTATTTPAD